MDSVAQHLGRELLRRLRRQAGLTQKELAEASHLSPDYISALERGERRHPTAGVTDRIAGALRLNDADATALKDAFFPRLDLIVQPAAIERLDQQGGPVTEVWVISDEPAEVGDRGYRDTLEANLLRGVHYVYWTRSPYWFQTLHERMRHQAKDVFANSVDCITSPEEASWFSFVIHNPRARADHATGRMAIFANDGIRLSHTAPLDRKSLRRILHTLHGVYEFLSSEASPRVATTRGYAWHRRSPRAEFHDGRGGNARTGKGGAI
jgi:transcriptional regulator with XRE-family HTH domain